MNTTWYFLQLDTIYSPSVSDRSQLVFLMSSSESPFNFLVPFLVIEKEGSDAADWWLRAQGWEKLSKCVKTFVVTLCFSVTMKRAGWAQLFSLWSQLQSWGAFLLECLFLRSAETFLPVCFQFLFPASFNGPVSHKWHVLIAGPGEASQFLSLVVLWRTLRHATSLVKMS